MLQRGASTEGLEEGSTVDVVFFSLRESRKDMLRVLLKYGVITTEFRDGEGRDLLKIFGTRVRSYDDDAGDIFRTLASHGLSFDRSAGLFWSIDKQNVELVRYFVEEGAEVNQVSEVSPLFLAILRGSRKIVDLLLKNGADLTERGEELGVSPLILAVNTGNREVVELLVSRGARVNAKDDRGWTALHEACNCSDSPSNMLIVDLLLRHGADVRAEDAKGQTPLAKLAVLNFELFEYFHEVSRGCLILLLKEYSRLSFENVPISTRDMDLINGDPVAREMFGRFRSELERMSRTRFHGELTYYCVLKMSRNVRKLSRLTKSEDFFFKFWAQLCDFGCWMYDLDRILDMALKVEPNFEASFAKLYPIFRNYLPKLVIEKLADFIPPEDLPEK